MANTSIKFVKSNSPIQHKDDFYHNLLKASWPKLISFYFLFLLGLNLFFAGLYFFIPGSLNISDPSFLQCFFFSIQTVSTVGYGVISPASTLGNIVVCFEIILGLIVMALTTGLIFAKFSKPISKILFTKNILINNFNQQRVLSFRCANGRNNQIISASVELFLLHSEVTAENHKITRFTALPLQRSYSPIFALSWTIFHTIDQSSPLFNLTIEEMKNRKYEFVILINGIDETYSQTIHQTYYYEPEDIIFDQYFEDIIKRAEDGTRYVDYKFFNELKK